MKRISIKSLTIIFVALFSYTNSQAQFIISAEIRPRTELRYGFKTPRQSDDEPAFFTEQRSRLNFNFIDSSYSFRLSMQDVRVWGENAQIFKQEDGNTFLSEAWVDYKLDANFSIKAGRQIISYDNQRYFGGLEWAQQGRRHDAVLLKFFNPTKKVKVDAGVAFNADDDVPEPLNIQSPDALFYSANNYKQLHYIWYHKQFSAIKFSIMAVNLGFQTNEEEVSFRQTVGTNGKSLGEKFQIGWDAYYQFGESGASKVRAFLTGLNLTYQTEVTPLTIGAEFISGKDDDDNSTDIKHFSPDFGTNHAHNGYMDYFFVGPANGTVGVADIYLKTKFKLTKGKLVANAHHFLAGSKQFDNTREELSRSMGTELDLVFVRPLKKSVTFHLGYSFLVATETMAELRGRDGDFNSWAWMMFTVKPQLFKSKKR